MKIIKASEKITDISYQVDSTGTLFIKADLIYIYIMAEMAKKVDF